MSVVLVIIGLIIGGILVGAEMVKAAEVRRQITQIQNFNIAANTFKGKYGALPGDITSSLASQFGLTARPGTGAGQGNGDNVIQGYTGGFPCDPCVTSGESALFWTDLSTTGLIAGTYNGTGTPSVIPVTGLTSYIPPAMLGVGNVVVIFSYNGAYTTNVAGIPAGTNFFGIENVSVATQITGDFHWNNNTSPTGISVSQASQIDTKIDDGSPQSGSVLAGGIGTLSNAEDIMWSSSTGSTPCITGSGTYALSTSSNAATCALMFKGQF